eukprot:GHVR01190379.1.p1 GENE.GHVR01190379.1~~GHVR01190379.1.p1  ORF type:complete len:561 (-),score=128.12 GHVR01190379.1:411-2093(-)
MQACRVLPRIGRVTSMSRCFSTVPFRYQDIFQEDTPVNYPYTKISSDVKVSKYGGKSFIEVDGDALRKLAREAIIEVSHFLRPGHLQQLASILKDPDATPNDQFVALELLKNANVASGKQLPGCQDTGTAIIVGKKGQQVLTNCDDAEMLSGGVYDAYTGTNLRYSQVAPMDMFTEGNTGSNLPAQVELYACEGDAYKFIFFTKGGGSANKTFLFQQTKALLNEKSLYEFLKEKITSLGTSACPPYHLAVVIGGLSAEMNLKTVKLASARYLDGLYQSGNEYGRGFRDIQWEAKLLQMSRDLGIGAQFGGKYFCHDVRVIRLPRHGASCPVGIGVSCSADRQAVAKITSEGVFLEQLEHNPADYLPEVPDSSIETTEVVKVDLNRPMEDVLRTLSKYPIKTRLALSGTLIVARDIAHAKLMEVLQTTGTLPDYVKNHPIYYAGPAKTPPGMPSGSFGPTTAGRMDSYVEPFQAAGGSMITLAKGNRSKVVRESCKRHGGFYLGSVGGPAAVLAQNNIKKIETIAYKELGMEAVWKIDVVNFPAFIVVDDKGNDFFEEWTG